MTTTVHRELDEQEASRILRWALSWARHSEHPFAIVVVNPAGEVLGQGQLEGAKPGLIETALERAKAALQDGFDPEVNPGGCALRHRRDNWLFGAIGVAGRPGQQGPRDADGFIEPYDGDIATLTVHNFLSPGEE